MLLRCAHVMARRRRFAFALVGYERVAAFAKRVGLNDKIKGYPAVALGAFEVTPIEMAARSGEHILPAASGNSIRTN